MSMRARRLGLIVAIIGVGLLAHSVPASAATGPLFDVKARWGDTNLPPGGQALFAVQVRNIGDAVTAEDLTITDELPEGVTIADIEWPEVVTGDDALSSHCGGVGTRTVTCVLPAATVAAVAQPPGLGIGFEAPVLIPKGYLPWIYLEVDVAADAAGVGTNTATVSGGGMAPCGGANPPCPSDVDPVQFDSAPAPFEVVPGSFAADVFEGVYPFGERSRQAGAHPVEQRVKLDLSARSGVNESRPTELLGARYMIPTKPVKDVEATLPPGLIGNPEAVPKCDPVDFNSAPTFTSTGCPPDTQVGYVNVSYSSGIGNRGLGSFARDPGVANQSRIAVYNLVPPKGTPVDLGLSAGNGWILAHIYATLDASQNYAIKAVSPDISGFLGIRGFELTLWGVPADPMHDKLRYSTAPKGLDPGPPPTLKFLDTPWGTAPIRPFFTNPMDCGFDNGGHRLRVDSYTDPGEFTPSEEDGNALNVNGCDDPRFSFEPEVALRPTDEHAGAPTGLDVNLRVPQRDDEVANATELYAGSEKVKAIATPPIKRAVVTLPEGMTISPSAAQGLGACSPAEIGLGTDSSVRCPDSSQFGTLTLHTPLLPQDAQPEGWIYVAEQEEHPPPGELLRLYLAIQEPERGILVKLVGRVKLDLDTGQITTTFDDLPQFPVSDMQLHFKSGVRAGLVNPGTCGEKTITAEFFSWQDPGTPHVVQDSYDITQRADGGPCPATLGDRPFDPTFQAGTLNNRGGSFSPFLMRLTRTDDDQELARLGVDLPAGLTAKFAGVDICSDAAIARAASRTGAGQGSLERREPSCPASSRIGGTQVGAGVGVPLTYVPGDVYLAGPYKGAPISAVAISPVIVGPFDLGVIVVRGALHVNPVTAQGAIATDALPRIFQGVPVRIRDVQVSLDRADFTLNPTSCAEKSINAHIIGMGGDLGSTADDTLVDPSTRFQAADCVGLPFRPHLALRLFGGTERGDHPKLRAVARLGDGANISRAVVALPKSEFLDQGHIRTVCTRVQFAEEKCPNASIYGYAVARTPLFGQPLRGPVYLRSSSHTLPDVVAALSGPPAQPVKIELAGRIDSVRSGGIRNTFDLVPDAPVDSFVFYLKGGKKGLLVNSRDLCAGRAPRGTATFAAQNGRLERLRPRVTSSCGKGGG